MQQARKEWKETQSTLATHRLFFLDESGINTKMIRLYGRSQKGIRCVDKVPHGHWKTNTFIAALSHDGLVAPWVLDGPMNKEAFVTYLEEVLGPILKPGDILIMDNLSSHKNIAVPKIIEARGAKILFLPAYSPDLNPIENFFSKLKAHLRKAAARTLDTILSSISYILNSLTKEECSNYFRHSGYTGTI